jgi:hypothetical protein
VKETNKIGTQLRIKDEANFTLHESVLLMVKDGDLNKLLFTVSVSLPGKHPVSDRDAGIKKASPITPVWAIAAFLEAAMYVGKRK